MKYLRYGKNSIIGFALMAAVLLVCGLAFANSDGKVKTTEDFFYAPNWVTQGCQSVVPYDRGQICGLGGGTAANPPEADLIALITGAAEIAESLGTRVRVMVKENPSAIATGSDAKKAPKVITFRQTCDKSVSVQILDSYQVDQTTYFLMLQANNDTTSRVSIHGAGNTMMFKDQLLDCSAHLAALANTLFALAMAKTEVKVKSENYDTSLEGSQKIDEIKITMQIELDHTFNKNDLAIQAKGDSKYMYSYSGVGVEDDFFESSAVIAFVYQDQAIRIGVKNGLVSELSGADACEASEALILAIRGLGASAFVEKLPRTENGTPLSKATISLP